MFGMNFLCVKESKIPRTRRSSGISKDDLHELQHKPCLTSNLHMPDGPLTERLAPTVEFRKLHVCEDVIEGFTDGQASGNSNMPDITDDGLASPDTDIYSNYEVVWTVISILSYIFDVGSDVYLAFVYYSDGDIWWFVLTVIFIVVPSLTITIFSFVWYIEDRGNQSYPLVWLPRLVLLLLQLGPLLRYIDTMIFGFWSKYKDRRHYWYKLKTYEETDSALLRLLECFMEAAPQLTLQLYIILSHGIKQNPMLSLGQIISCVTSLVSISWAVAAYQKALRLSLPSKAKLDCCCIVFLFMWRILIIGPRVLALAVFASCTQYGFFVLCGIHWIVMLMWILIQRTTFCSTKIQEFCFNAVAAFICIFDFFNLIEGRTRLRYVIYYSLMYCENVAMVIVWYFYRSTTAGWYLVPVVIVVVAVFWLGILLQAVYYLAFHPNNKPPYAHDKRIRICVPLSELVDFRRDDPSKVGAAV